MNKQLKVKKINNENVKPIPIKIDKRPVKGNHVSPHPYMNIFLLAPTNCGKTCALFHLLKRIAGPKTNIIAFVSTQNMDSSWDYIEEYFNKKKISMIIHDEMEEDGMNHLEELKKYWKNDRKNKTKKKNDECEKDSVDLIKQLNHLNDIDSESDSEDEYKSKYQYPENILVFDDMGDQLRNPILTHFLKKSRHFKCKILVSSQAWTDMCPSARKQIKQFLIFHSNGQDRLKSIYENMGCQFEFDKFKELYDTSTVIDKKNKKPFLFAIPHLNDYRICFDKKFEL